MYKAHSAFQDAPMEEYLGAMNEGVEAGQIDVIGCSNFRAGQLREALDISDKNGWARFQITQPPYSLARSNNPSHLDRVEAEAEFFPLCVKEGVGITPYSPLAAGFLAGKYTPDRSMFPKGTRFDVVPGHADIYFEDRNFKLVEKLRAKSDEMGLPMVKLGMAWVMANKSLTSVLVGARRTAHVDNAIEAMDMECCRPNSTPKWRLGLRVSPSTTRPTIRRKTRPLNGTKSQAVPCYTTRKRWGGWQPSSGCLSSQSPSVLHLLALVPVPCLCDKYNK